MNKKGIEYLVENVGWSEAAKLVGVRQEELLGWYEGEIRYEQ